MPPRRQCNNTNNETLLTESILFGLSGSMGRVQPYICIVVPKYPTQPLTPL